MIFLLISLEREQPNTSELFAYINLYASPLNFLN